MNKIGFCFTGEGSRGSVQAGIAYALNKKGIDADFTIGISSGSICAASYAYLGPEGLAKMWSNIRNVFDVFGFNYNFFFKTGLLNQRPMQKIVAEAMQNEPICESVVVRMNIEDGSMDYVSNKNVSKQEFEDAVLGSVAITGLVEDKNGWVDAGSRQLTPLKQCIEAGCTEIYVIMGRPLELQYWIKPKGFFNLFQMAFRALDITLYEIMTRDINNCLKNEQDKEHKGIKVYPVEPNKLLFDSINFSMCKRGVEFGKVEYTIRNERAFKNLISPEHKVI